MNENAFVLAARETLEYRVGWNEASDYWKSELETAKEQTMTELRISVKRERWAFARGVFAISSIVAVLYLLSTVR